jgi:tRNA nucleotidyltransferase (CCA-adding enzyme)
LTELRKTRTVLSGKDLQSMGYPPGPIFKKILTSLLEAKLEGKVSNREEEAGYVTKRFPLETSPQTGK